MKIQHFQARVTTEGSAKVVTLCVWSDLAMPWPSSSWAHITYKQEGTIEARPSSYGVCYRWSFFFLTEAANLSMASILVIRHEYSYELEKNKKKTDFHILIFRNITYEECYDKSNGLLGKELHKWKVEIQFWQAAKPYSVFQYRGL